MMSEILWWLLIISSSSAPLHSYSSSALSYQHNNEKKV
jgi:hypothetical protein